MLARSLSAVAQRVFLDVVEHGRFDTPLDGLPRTMAAFDACMALEAFQKAQPSACPDAQG
jgi:hypothetical protein